MNHKVTVLAGEPKAEKLLEEEINGVKIIRWPAWSPGNAYHIPRFRPKLEKSLASLIKRIDLAHVHNVHTVLPIWAATRILKYGLREE